MTAKKRAVSVEDLRMAIDAMERIEQEAQGFGELLACSIAVKVSDDLTVMGVYEGERPEWKITLS